MSEDQIALLIDVGKWVIGLIGLLIVTAARLSWQASKVTSSVNSGTVAINALRVELAATKSEVKEEVRIIHRRIDEHDNRIRGLELDHVPGSGTRYDDAHKDA
ncbi:MAG: hypothetical protein ACF8CY_02385 [Gimesia chilikensis]